MDYMKDIKEISAEEAVILWQASRLSLSKIYEKAPEILKVQGSVIGTLGNFSASIGKAKSQKDFQCVGYRGGSIEEWYSAKICGGTTRRETENPVCGHGTKSLSLSESHETYFTDGWASR